MSRRRRAELGFLTFLMTVPAPAETTLAPENSAVPVSRGHLEAGLTSNSTYGLSDRLSLGLHPLVFFMLPHTELKISWWQSGHLYFSTRHRLAYPSPFLNLVAKEGSLGLLPANTDVPAALQIAGDAWFSTTQLPGQVLSVWAGVSAAAVGDSENLSLLDFPFLYQRFVDLYAPWVLRSGLGLQGHLARAAYYAVETRAWLFRLDEPRMAGVVVESTLLAGYEPWPDWRFVLGAKSALGRFPIGIRLHLMPVLDVRHAF